MNRGGDNVKMIFLVAVGLLGDDRRRFLDDACAGNEALRREVEALLAHHTESGSVLGEGIGGWPPGQVGDYRILGIAGEGGMGVVYQARKPGGEVVALKVLRGGAPAPEWLARFRRETDLLRRFDHPNIARFHEAGTFDAPTGPQPFYAMEFVDGLKLGDWAAERRPTEVQKLELLAELCDAVHYTHAQGVIHRDLKPGNILVTPEGRPKLIDFGIAAREHTHTAATTFATGTQVMLGTVPYMSPEQAQNAPEGVDARSDIYALGVMAYELLTGRLPYDSASPSIGRALHAILNTEPQRIGTLERNLRGNVEHIVHCALEKNPAHRYPTAAAMAEDLRHHLAGHRVRMSVVQRWRRARRRLHARPRLRAALAIVIAAAAVAAVAAAVDRLAARDPAVDARVRWNDFYSNVEAADRCRHYGAGSPAKWRECIALFRNALTELDRLPARAFTNDLKRYAYFRLGELHYFIGEHDHDPALLDEARAQWDQWRAFSWQLGTANGIDSTYAFRQSLLQLGKHSAQGGVGLSLAKSATYRDRVTNLRLALTQQEQVKDMLVSARDTWQPDANSASERASALGIAELNIGANWVRLGAAVDSVALIDRGIEILQRTLSRSPDRTPRHQGNLYLWLVLAEASLARAELAGAELEPAFAYFDSARQVLFTGEFRSTWRLGCGEAQAWMLAAARSRDSAAARRALEQAALALDGSMQQLRDPEDDFEIAVSRALAARVHVEQDAFVGADSLLTLAARVLTPQRVPIQCAEMELERGKMFRRRAARDGNPTDLVRTRKSLTRAGNLVPAAQYPHLARLVAAESRLLAAAESAAAAIH
jgi:predicted Ser/Thr protein kinase